jgi:30S ribosomal protein S31
LKRTLQQAAGNLHREEFYLFSDSLANPAASCGECARYRGSKGGYDMGKGDQRTKRGKIWKGTYGKTRPRKKKKKEPRK